MRRHDLRRPLCVLSLAIAFAALAVGTCCAEEGGTPAFGRFARGVVGVVENTSRTFDGDDPVTDDDSLFALGFGSVAVNFQGTRVLPTGNRGAVGDDDFEDTPSIADDLNGNGSTLFFIGLDTDGDGDLDDIVGAVTDYGDLFEFDVFFDEVRVDAVLRANSYELMKQHVLHASPGVNTRATGWRFDSFVENWQLGIGDQVNARNPVAEERWRSIENGKLRTFVREMRTATYATAGLRVNDYRSWYAFEGFNSVLGRTYARVENDHFGIGPQAGLGGVAESSFWRFEAVALGFLGYQHTNYELNGVVGQELIPGAFNRPVTSRTTTTYADANEDDFAWGFEARLTAGAQLTQRWRFDTTWRWAVIGPIHDASSSLRYTVPNFTLIPADGDEMYLSDLFLGLTYTR